MKSVHQERFMMVFELLETAGIISSRAEAALKLDYKPQAFTEILKGRSGINLELIHKFCIEYGVNPNFIILGDGDLFLSKNVHLNVHPNVHPDSKKTVKNGNVYKPPDSSNEPVSQYFCENCKQKQLLLDTQKDLIDSLKSEKELLKLRVSELQDKLNDPDHPDQNGQKRKAS